MDTEIAYNICIKSINIKQFNLQTGINKKSMNAPNVAFQSFS